MNKYKLKESNYPNFEGYLHFEDFDDELSDRMIYILTFWLSLFDFKFTWLDENENGFYSKNGYIDEIDFSFEATPLKSNCFTVLDKNGKKISTEHFPIRFLFEDFEEELVNGKELFKAAELDRAAKRKLNKHYKNKDFEYLIDRVSKQNSSDDLLALLSISDKKRKSLIKSIKSKDSVSFYNKKDKALFILSKMKKSPKVYAYTKEAFLSGVVSIIMMASDNPFDFDASKFYSKHLKVNDSEYKDLCDQINTKWAINVVDNAISILEK